MFFTPWLRTHAGCVAVGIFALACKPELVVGTLSCEGAGGIGAVDETTFSEAEVRAPWSSGFEYGECEWSSPARFCYADPRGSFESVRTPTHSGKYAYAFSVDTSETEPDPGQARCVVEGELPEEAYYGAWYLVPTEVTNLGNWNLLHFEGGSPDARRALWDVSLRSTADGQLMLDLYDFARPQIHFRADGPTIPIGSWFHIELYLKRATDDTGAIALYQDGELLVELTDLSTTDSDWAQWYVGNLADALEPSRSTVYVDDISITNPR